MNAKVILCPTDFSPESERALELASTLAAESGAVLVILHVVGPPVTLDGAIHAGALRVAADAIEALKKIQPAQTNVECVRSLQWGDAQKVILRTAKNQNADMIVMGTHGRTGVGRLFLGSVAEQVMRHATCPVLTVKQPVGAVSNKNDERTIDLTFN